MEPSHDSKARRTTCACSRRRGVVRLAVRPSWNQTHLGPVEMDCRYWPHDRGAPQYQLVGRPAARSVARAGTVRLTGLLSCRIAARRETAGVDLLGREQ